VTDEEWATVFDVQLTGAYRAIRTSAREMETGSILHVASASAGTAIPDPVVYSAAERLDGFVRVAADELAPEIRVDAVRPGFVRSERTEGTPRFEAIRERTTGGRLTRPEEVVGAAVSLASDAASYATGEIATVDGGFVAATFEERRGRAIPSLAPVDDVADGTPVGSRARSSSRGSLGARAGASRSPSPSSTLTPVTPAGDDPRRTGDRRSGARRGSVRASRPDPVRTPRRRTPFPGSWGQDHGRPVSGPARRER
jgi:hypothetical protein